MKDEHMALAVINHSMGVLREVAALPDQTEVTLQRALTAAKAIDDACKWLMAWAGARALMARAAL